MNKKFELLREAVNTYKVNHCDGNKNEKALLEFIEELEQLIIPVVSKIVAKKYAEFCVECDREGFPLLLIDDYIEQYCC